MGTVEVHRIVVLPADAASVWDLLTEGDRMSTWFGAEVTIEARPGGRATFTWPDGRERTAVIETLESRRRLELRWLPFERAPDGTTRLRTSGRIRFSLASDPEGTVLEVLEERLEPVAVKVDAPRGGRPGSSDPDTPRMALPTAS